MALCELHHVEDGPADAPPLVLGGSLGAALEMWDPQVAALAERRRLVRFDHRGHGGSPVPSGPYAIADLGGDVLSLLDRLGLERVSYCGLSLGGMVGIWLAVNAPRRIDSLVLICTSAHMPPASAWLERAAAVRESASVEVVADAVLARWLTPAFAAEQPETTARLRAGLVATPAEGYAACCEAIAPMDLRSALGAIAAPTLVIGGSLDPSTTVAGHARPLARGIPGARLEVLPAAHLASAELPADVNRLIADHLDRREAP